MTTQKSHIPSVKMVTSTDKLFYAILELSRFLQQNTKPEALHLSSRSSIHMAWVPVS